MGKRSDRGLQDAVVYPGRPVWQLVWRYLGSTLVGLTTARAEGACRAGFRRVALRTMVSPALRSPKTSTRSPWVTPRRMSTQSALPSTTRITKMRSVVALIAEAGTNRLSAAAAERPGNLGVHAGRQFSGTIVDVGFDRHGARFGIDGKCRAGDGCGEGLSRKCRDGELHAAADADALCIRLGDGRHQSQTIDLLDVKQRCSLAAFGSRRGCLGRRCVG